MTLTRKIMIAIVAAIFLGSLTKVALSAELPHWLTYFLQTVLVDGVFTLGGNYFLSGLRLLVVPVVFVSLVCGVCQMTDQRALGRIGGKTLAFYIFTTIPAIGLALTLALLIGPGDNINMQTATDYVAPEAMPLIKVLSDIFPNNPVAAMAQGNMLQIIVFSMLLGLAIGASGESGKRLGLHFVDWNEAVMKLVNMVMWVAPYGVFCLLFTLFAKQGISTVGDLLLYMLTVAGALVIHNFVFYPLLLKLFTGLSPWQFIRKMRSVQLFAFSTATSNATIPINMQVTENKLGVHNRVAAFCIPLGATVNMDGTAIMQGVATVFIAQAFGVPLGIGDYITIMLIATLASIGTAGVPSVGLITLAMVLQQVNLPVEGIALIIGVDRILDMMRTAVNITGDSTVAVIVGKSEGALDESIYFDPDAGEKPA